MTVGAILALVGLLYLNERWEQHHSKRDRDDLKARPWYCCWLGVYCGRQGRGWVAG